MSVFGKINVNMNLLTSIFWKTDVVLVKLNLSLPLFINIGFSKTDINKLMLASIFSKIDVNELTLFTNMSSHFC